MIRKLEIRRDRFSLFRPWVLGAGLIGLFWFGFIPLLFSVALLSLDSFYYHRVGKKIRRWQEWGLFKSDQIARQELLWDRLPLPYSAQPEPLHPFSRDLDITGQQSLHRLVDTSVSLDGSRRLLQWMLQPEVDLALLQRNREVIRELVGLSRFRNKLHLTFRLVSREQLDGRKLEQWLSLQPPVRYGLRLVVVSCLLTISYLLLFFLFQLQLLAGYWIFPLLLYLGLYFRHSSFVKQQLEVVGTLHEEQRKFRRILLFLEKYPYHRALHLKQFCSPYHRKESAPSLHLRKITWMVNLVGLRMNPLLGLLLNLILPYDFLLIALIHKLKGRYAKLFPLWLATWSDLEAMVSLANHAYLHPENVFPEILPHSSEHPSPVLEGKALGHPFLSQEKRVCNDITFQQLGNLKLLTGSNMAGKSTFLKTLGINLCLAYSGGAIYAQSLRTQSFRIFTCIQVWDSITDGLSFFYAEVQRLKAMLAAISEEKAPVICLVDEIFRGTNSREHFIGSCAYISHLAKSRCIGLISTHDLVLAKTTGSFSGVENCHFRDEWLEDRMIFDYKLYPGICPTTNALKIMRLEGLPISGEWNP